MLATTGMFYRLRSDDNADNLGLKVKFDILVVFTEGFGLSEEDIENLNMMLEARLRGLAFEMPFAKKKEVEAATIQVLEALGYEPDRVIVNQALTCATLLKEVI